jgi:uncharacterized protein (TIGR02757 family)
MADSSKSNTYQIADRALFLPPDQLRDYLERLYLKYNRREYLHPDPLEFLWRYSSTKDREIVGLLASGLAYGRVAQILKSTERILTALGSDPSGYLKSVSLKDFSEAISGFKHRFTTSSETAALLKSVSELQEEWGLLGNMLSSYLSEGEYLNALDRFVDTILKRACLEKCSLLPRPSRGSACKRLHLFMRWMVRRDDVDPGGWDSISPSVLIVPLDVHMFRAAGALGLTEKKVANQLSALEITEGFRLICPGDPVKFDFALTRMGIQQLQKDKLFSELFPSES